ncbi:hypothetical protein ACU686_23045 [Yinghuangia aomiensis]
MTGQAFAPQWPAALGARPAGERLARVRRSPHFVDGAFRNLVPTRRSTDGAVRLMLRARREAAGLRRPTGEIPLTVAPRGGLRGRARVGAAGDLAGACHGAGRDRRAPGAVRPGVEHALLAVGGVRPRRLHPMPMRWSELPTSTRWSSRTTTTTTWTWRP